MEQQDPSDLHRIASEGLRPDSERIPERSALYQRFLIWFERSHIWDSSTLDPVSVGYDHCTGGHVFKVHSVRISENAAIESGLVRAILDNCSDVIDFMLPVMYSYEDVIHSALTFKEAKEVKESEADATIATKAYVDARAYQIS